MKKRQKAFTLIELLVAVSIIGIVSFTGVFGFLRFVEENSLKIKTNQIINQIEIQDKKVTNKQIFDYKAVFDSSQNDFYYIYENIAGENVKQKINSSGSGSLGILLEGNSGNNWYTSVFKEHKLDLSKNVGIQEHDIFIEDGYDYRIIGTMSGTTNKSVLNNIIFKKIDKEESEIIITKITDTIGGNDIKNLEITNIGGRKNISSSGSKINEAFIYFDKNGTESFINIKK